MAGVHRSTGVSLSYKKRREAAPAPAENKNPSVVGQRLLNITLKVGRDAVLCLAAIAPFALDYAHSMRSIQNSNATTERMEQKKTSGNLRTLMSGFPREGYMDPVTEDGFVTTSSVENPQRILICVDEGADVLPAIAHVLGEYGAKLERVLWTGGSMQADGIAKNAPPECAVETIANATWRLRDEGKPLPPLHEVGDNQYLAEIVNRYDSAASDNADHDKKVTVMVLDRESRAKQPSFMDHYWGRGEQTSVVRVREPTDIARQMHAINGKSAPLVEEKAALAKTERP